MSRGINRERQVRLVLEHDGWFVVRAAGSFGVADLVALRRGDKPRLIECKSTIGPYDHFGPADRRALLDAANAAGAVAELAWWPSRRPLTFIASWLWPTRLELRA